MIYAFQNDFAFIISTETCFWLKRVTDRDFFSAFQKGFSNPLIKTALRLSSPKITLKVVWKPLILRQKCDDKRTFLNAEKSAIDTRLSQKHVSVEMINAKLF